MLNQPFYYYLKDSGLAERTISEHLKDITRFEQWAKENNLTRQVGALYDVAKTIMRTRKMPKRFLNHSLPPKNSGFEYIITGSKTKTYYNIENKWKVRIPMNRGDIEDYLTWTLNP